jgi:hypothetical protein
MNKGIAMRRARVVFHGVTLLFLLALIASCDNDTTGPLEQVTPLLIAGGDMGAQLQDLTITREGVAITDGTVTVNGVAIPHAGSGRYVGQLPDAVPAGSPINLQVSAGGATVQGTVNVPEAPVLTAPATGAAFAAADYITVSWTSATDPDRFIVYGAWVVDDVGFRKSFPAAATAREIKIAAFEFPGADITISVVAYNDGSFTGQAHPDSRMSVCGEGPPNAAITRSPPTLHIWGGMAAQTQNLWIHQDVLSITAGVSDAVVTVNGAAIPHAGGYPAYYSGALPAAVPAGSPLDLRVSARGLIVEATGNVPEAPVLTDADAGSGSVTIRWTSATNPDRFVVYVNRNGSVLHREVPGAARELEIAASELPAGRFTVFVVAYNDGSFSGPADPGSRMGIRSVGRPITINR